MLEKIYRLVINNYKKERIMSYTESVPVKSRNAYEARMLPNKDHYRKFYHLARLHIKRKPATRERTKYNKNL